MNAPDRAAAEVQQLLNELCVDLGLCLPPHEQQRLRDSPPHDVGAFADAVFTAEGMDPSPDKRLHRHVCERVERRIDAWAFHSNQDPSI